MPVRREGRNVIANPEELNQWLRRTSGEAAGVHVVTPGADLLKDLRASLAARKQPKDVFRKTQQQKGSRFRGERAHNEARGKS